MPLRSSFPPKAPRISLTSALSCYGARFQCHLARMPECQNTWSKLLKSFAGRETKNHPDSLTLEAIKGEVYFRRCTRRMSSSCRPRCHRWPCDTATEPQLVRLRRVRLCAAMCRTWEGSFSLQGCDDHGGCSGCFRLFSYTPTLSNPYLATHTHSSTHRDAARCQRAPQHPRQLANATGNAYQPYRITVKIIQNDHPKTVCDQPPQMI
jgi:hypothetical protein